MTPGVTLPIVTETPAGSRLEFTLSVKDLAAAWWSISDQLQADFFVEVARLAARDDPRAMQPWYIGRHLRDCPCATEEARHFLREIVSAIDAPRPADPAVDGGPF